MELFYYYKFSKEILYTKKMFYGFHLIGTFLRNCLDIETFEIFYARD